MIISPVTRNGDNLHYFVYDDQGNELRQVNADKPAWVKEAASRRKSIDQIVAEKEGVEQVPSKAGTQVVTVERDRKIPPHEHEDYLKLLPEHGHPDLYGEPLALLQRSLADLGDVVKTLLNDHQESSRFLTEEILGVRREASDRDSVLATKAAEEQSDNLKRIRELASEVSGISSQLRSLANRTYDDDYAAKSHAHAEFDDLRAGLDDVRALTRNLGADVRAEIAAATEALRGEIKALASAEHAHAEYLLESAFENYKADATRKANVVLLSEGEVAGRKRFILEVQG